jgi:hypothetical protein
MRLRTGLLSPDLAAGVKGAKRLGVQVGNCLTAEPVRTLIAAPSGAELREVRNGIILAMLIGCALRRAGIDKGSGTPNKDKKGKVTEKQIIEIATQKMPDLNSTTVEAAARSIRGTARSMGIEVTA